MITDAARRVAALAAGRRDLSLGKPSFRPPQFYKSQDFNIGNFRQIFPCRDNHPRIASLDGGNLPLIEAPSFAVHFCRLYFNIFKGGTRLKSDIPNRIEFFAVATSSSEGDSISYETHLIPFNPSCDELLPDAKDMSFDSYDESIREGRERAQISRLGDIARSFAEWNYASFVCKELDEGDLFVRDGTLHAPYAHQSKYADKSYDAAREKGVLFCGVSKTSQLYTTSGLPLVAAIGRLARENNIKAPGYYENIVDISDPSHKADMSIARLHPRASHSLRIEILKSQEAHKDWIMAALAFQSGDVSFPGYPYGLIDADKNARVGYEELDSLRMLLLSELSKTGHLDELRDFLSASDAHDWLNAIV
jgi:hypothetical protein